jgi:hypothetical protein
MKSVSFEKVYRLSFCLKNNQSQNRYQKLSAKGPREIFGLSNVFDTAE